MNNCKPENLLLYAVTDRAWLKPGQTLAEQVEQCLLGGATFVQLREKHLGREEMLKEAIAVREVCARYGVPFVVDDDVEVALLSGADGVHVGQSDMEASNARAALGPDKIVGVTCKTVEQAQAALAAGADYLGSGAMFPTGTKTDTSLMSKERLAEICASTPLPVVAIGGIGAGNVAELAGTGADGVAVVSALFAAEDIRAAAEELKARTRAALGL